MTIPLFLLVPLCLFAAFGVFCAGCLLWSEWMQRT